MRIILPTLLFCTVFVFSATAQDSCPTVTVQGPAGIPNLNEPVVYRASVEPNENPSALAYRWTVSSSEILSGQGTSTIAVRYPAGSITVTVEVTGPRDGCSATASESSIWDPIPEATKIGEMLNTVPPDLELIRRFRDELRDNPNNQGYIFIAYPPILPKAQVAARERVVRDVLDNERVDGHGQARLTLFSITSSRDVTEFWLVPPGADIPMCEACEPARGGCPSIGIERRANIVNTGDHIEFSVSDRDKVGGLSFQWAVKNGKIESGQGTSTIRVRPLTYLTRPVEAAVRVRGLPDGCANTFEESYAVPCHPYLATSIDVSFWSEYRAVPWNQEREQLEGVVARGLRWQPEKIVYIEKGFPLNSTVRSRNAAISRIRSYVLATLKIPRDKLYIRSRIGRSATRLYLVPANAPVLDPNWKESCVESR